MMRLLLLAGPAPASAHAIRRGIGFASAAPVGLAPTASGAQCTGGSGRGLLNRCFGTAASRHGSPHAVLRVRRDATGDEIKSAFRKLAKVHHPDLRAHQKRNDGDTAARDDTLDDAGRDGIMAELIDAYETLMRKNDTMFWTDAGDSRVAMACEMYTLEELRGMKDAFDVYPFRMQFVDEKDEGEEDDEDDESHTGEGGIERNYCNGGNDIGPKQAADLDAAPIVPLLAHPDESVSDLKRRIQSRHAESWGIDGRRVDKDGLHLGWELVRRHSTIGGDGISRGGGSEGSSNIVLSYHLFLSDYGIIEDDVLFAVVRREVST